MPIAVFLMALLTAGFAQAENKITAPNIVPALPLCKPSAKHSVMQRDPNCISLDSAPTQKHTQPLLPDMFGKKTDSNTNLGGNVIMDKSEKNQNKRPEERVLGAEVEFGIKTK